MAWDDTAPTQQELTKAAPTGQWDDAAPTATELSSISPEDAGSLDALAKGLGKGVTLGFAPEILAGVKAISTKGWDKQAYYDELAKQQAAFRGAEANHPWISAGGNIAGSLPIMALTGGLGAAGEAAEGAGVLARLGNAAKVGAGLGAAQGLADSDAQLLNGDVGQAAWDTAKGAATGAAGGALIDGGLQAVGGLVKGAKWAGNELLNESRFGNVLKDNFNLGSDKISTVGKTAIQNSKVAQSELAQEIATAAENTRSKAGKKIGEALDKVLNSDARANLEEQFKELQAGIDSLRKSSLDESSKDADVFQRLLDDIVKGRESTSYVSTPYMTEGTPAQVSAREKLGKLKSSLDAQDNYFGGSSNPDIANGEWQASVDKEASEAASEKAGREVEVLGNIKQTTPNSAVGKNSRYSIVPIPGEDGQNYVGLFDKQAGTIVKQLPDTPGAEATLGQLQEQLTPVVERTGGTTSPTVAEANQLKRDFSTLGKFGPSSQLKTPDAQNLASRIADSIKGVVSEASPELSQANKDYADAKRLQELLGLSSDDFYTNPGTDEETLKPGALNKMLDFVRGSAGDSSSAQKVQEKLEQVDPIFNLLSKINPEMKDLGQKVKDTANRMKVVKEANRNGIFDKFMLNNSNTARVANYAGRAYAEIPEGIKTAFSKVGSMTGGIAQAIQNGDQKSLNYLIGIGKNRYPKLTEKLTEAVNSNFDQSRRNALVFSLLQDPTYRQQMHELGTGVKGMFSSDNNNGDVK